MNPIETSGTSVIVFLVLKKYLYTSLIILEFVKESCARLMKKWMCKVDNYNGGGKVLMCGIHSKLGSLNCLVLSDLLDYNFHNSQTWSPFLDYT